MLFNIFDNFTSIEGQYSDNSVYSVLIGSVLCYLALLVIIKNIIYYKKISENYYWILLIIMIIDFTIYINNNKCFIERKIKEYLPKFDIFKRKNKIKQNDLVEGLINENTNENVNDIINEDVKNTNKNNDDEYTSVIV
jgi:hypothetical protein